MISGPVWDPLSTTGVCWDYLRKESTVMKRRIQENWRNVVEVTTEERYGGYNGGIYTRSLND
jgi:hypothetical protein